MDIIAGSVSSNITETKWVNLFNLVNGTEYGIPTDDPSLNLTTVKGAKAQLLLYDYLIPVIGALIVCLNLAVVISSGLILRRGAEPRTTYLFLGNVAMADLVTGVAVLFGQLYPRVWRDQTTCAIQLGMIVSSTLASVWSVALIATDRFLYILHGLRYQRLLFPSRARILIVGTWFIGLSIGFLPAMGWAGKTDNGRVCWFIRLAPRELVLLTTAIGMLPIILVIVLYSIILYHAILKLRQLNRAHFKVSEQHLGGTNFNKNVDTQNMRIFRGGNNPHTKFSSKKWKAIKVVIFTSGSFVLTWMPYFIACSIYVFYTDDENLSRSLKVAIAAPLAILGFFNSLLNPVIYAWWHNGFRNFMHKVVCHKRQRKMKQSMMQTTSNKSITRTSTTKSSLVSQTKSVQESNSVSPSEVGSASNDETQL